MTLQSTETCLSISPKRDSILSITPFKFYLITISPFKVSHYYNNTVCSRQCRFSTTTWYTVSQVPSKMMNFWCMPWLCNQWFHHKNLVPSVTMYSSLPWSCALTVVIILRMDDLTSIIKKCEAFPMMPTFWVSYLLVLHWFFGIHYRTSECIPSNHHTKMKFP